MIVMGSPVTDGRRLFSPAARDDVERNVDADQEQGAPREDGIHRTDRDDLAEEDGIAVHAVADALHHRIREALRTHFFKCAAHGMVA